LLLLVLQANHSGTNLVVLASEPKRSKDVAQLARKNEELYLGRNPYRMGSAHTLALLPRSSSTTAAVNSHGFV